MVAPVLGFRGKVVNHTGKVLQCQRKGGPAAHRPLRMKTVKITAEFTVTPEMFSDWCDGDFSESEAMFKHFVEKTIFSNFGRTVNYDDVVGGAVVLDKDGLKMSFTEESI